jgi:hypothetical protein
MRRLSTVFSSRVTVVPIDQLNSIVRDKQADFTGYTAFAITAVASVKRSRLATPE